MQALARIRSLKKEQDYGKAQQLLDQETKALAGSDAVGLVKLSENEILATVCRDEPTQSVRDKMLIITTLLNEAGDIAAAQDSAQSAREYYLKALNVLLATLAREDVFEFPEFVPRIEELAGRLRDAPLPVGTLSLLMYHYERTGQFAKAEDMLFALLEANPGSAAAVNFGVAFYGRLLAKSDQDLADGHLPRSEAQESLDELQSKLASLGD